LRILSKLAGTGLVAVAGLWLGPAVSITAVAVQAATPSGSDLGLLAGEASSGPGGDGQIGVWGKFGTGTGS